MTISNNRHSAGAGSARPIATAARVWLVAALSNTGEPTDRPAVRDDLMRTWLPDRGTGYRSPNGRRRATWAELHARFDLMEVTS
ncbi:hypothetical protein [Rhodococcus sp. JS3073]|uniref:hypothetical protein n=1 Tax=Rhodococcus sp. JS3073 TaxID=3002901 RepID=UPI002285D8A7|nr:hypothetical protein [Rhodococcus sp. JS3073]WAM19399.1 hypothetical protein OYT95_43785 [Rhodococcus sp. JS3073]